ncbi:MAG: hypothetical protein K0U59_01905 [Gammaproteobacteria bacterium]|nr:hypothetical protein [Gammaproteobacteria bacterium]
MGNHATAIAERSARFNCVVIPSRSFAIILGLIVTQSLLLLYYCALPQVFAWPIGIAVLGFGALEGRRLRRIRGLLSTRDRRWFWRDYHGAEREFEIYGELVTWRWLLVINGRDTGGSHLRLVLAQDSVAPDDWRKLQMALRFSR